MRSTLVCDALFHILRQQNISLKILGRCEVFADVGRNTLNFTLREAQNFTFMR